LVGIGTIPTVSRLEVEGTAKFIETIYIRSVSPQDSSLIIGYQRPSDGPSYINLVSDTVYTTYGLRLIRNSGQNGLGLILYRGTGGFTTQTEDGAPITFNIYSSEKFRIDSTGNVGIGSTSPNAKLRVVGNVWATNFTGSFSGSIPQLSSYFKQGGNSFGTTATLGTNDASALAFETNGSTRMTLDTNGNLGIGTSSPTAKLHVEGISFFNNTISSSNKIIVESSQPGIIFRESDQSGTTNRWIDVEGGTFRILQTNNAYSSFTNQFVINSSGNVGIGTSVPAARLHVSSSNSAYAFGVNAATKGVRFNIDNTGATIQGVDNTFASSYQPLGLGGSYLYFQIQGSEVVRVDTNGNLGIGTSVPTATLTAYKSAGNFIFDLTNATEGNFKLRTYNSGSSTINTKTFVQGLFYSTTLNSGINYYRGGGAYDGYMSFSTNGIERMMLDKNGNVGIGTTSPVQKFSVVGNIYLPQGHSITWNNGDCEIAGVSGYHLVFRTYTGVSMTEKMRITSDGNVGIGSTTPAYKLQVSGSIAPVGDNKFPLGNPSNRFSDIFAAQSTIGGLFETGLRTVGLGEYQTGTIVSWEVDKCVPSKVEEDELVMGVVKNGKDEPLILGAEPILVTGKVDVGDYIVTSNKKGHGKGVKRGNIFKKDLFGKVIAQALESGSGESYTIKAMIRKM